MDGSASPGGPAPDAGLVGGPVGSPGLSALDMAMRRQDGRDGGREARGGDMVEASQDEVWWLASDGKRHQPKGDEKTATDAPGGAVGAQPMTDLLECERLVVAPGREWVRPGRRVKRGHRFTRWLELCDGDARVGSISKRMDRSERKELAESIRDQPVGPAGPVATHDPTGSVRRRSRPRTSNEEGQ